MSVNCCGHIVNSIYIDHLQCFMNEFERIRGMSEEDRIIYDKNECDKNIRYKRFVCSLCSLYSLNNIPRYRKAQPGIHALRKYISFILAIVCANGRLLMLQYGIMSGFQTNIAATGWAAQLGHADCLLFLTERRCPISDDALNFAIKYKRLECIAIAFDALPHDITPPYKKHQNKRF